MASTEAYSNESRDYYCPDFDYLCDALQRSDPTVTRVLVPEEYPLSFGHRLGTALQGNAIVNEIRLHLGRFREDRQREYQKYTGCTCGREEAYEWPVPYAAPQSEIEPLLAWLRSTSSLATVKLEDWGEYDVLRTGLLSLVLQEVLQAMAENPFGIQSLVADTPNFPLSHWTEYLEERGRSSATRRLQSLNIYITAFAGDLELEAAAQAIGGLLSLEVLELRGHRLDPILRRLLEPPSPLALLRELTLHDAATNPMTESTATLTSHVMLQSPQLVVFCLLRWTMDSDSWRIVSSGLRNPSISHFKVQHCHFLNDAWEDFLNDMHASNVGNDGAEPNEQVHHSLRHLELSSGSRPPLDRFAAMLCGPLLQHVTLDSHTVWPRDEPAFFNLLATNTSEGLRSLELKEMSQSILFNIAPYVASAKNLQHLVIEIDNRNRRTIPFTTIANAFLSALRRNSSLHRVEIRDFLDPHRDNDITSQFGHLIEAYTTRNRVLPELATKSFVVSTTNTDDTEELSATAGTNTDEAAAATGSQFPTLCQVSQPAPRLIPSTVLKGLMATSQDAVDSNSISRSGSGGESEQIP